MPLLLREFLSFGSSVLRRVLVQVKAGVDRGLGGVEGGFYLREGDVQKRRTVGRRRCRQQGRLFEGPL